MILLVGIGILEPAPSADIVDQDIVEVCGSRFNFS